jgi:hypothetical protein
MLAYRPWLVAAALALWACHPAAAQFGPTPSQEPPPCVQGFFKLRDEAQKRRADIDTAQKRKAGLPEACKLLNAFMATQNKILKYFKENASSCGIPPEIGKQIEDGRAQTSIARNRICQMAAAPPRPTGPSLSDALGGSSAPAADNIKSGHGTFDTLSGTPLGNK